MSSRDRIFVTEFHFTIEISIVASNTNEMSLEELKQILNYIDSVSILPYESGSIISIK
jgi:hypothetical protein